MGIPDPFGAPAGASVEQIATLAQANRCNYAVVSRHVYYAPSFSAGDSCGSSTRAGRAAVLAHMCSKLARMCCTPIRWIPC